MNHLNHSGHGNLCTCRILAEAVHCKPDVLLFSYCQSVLRKRWIIECNHGCQYIQPPTASHEKWHELGAMDPIKAILVENE